MSLSQSLSGSLARGSVGAVLFGGSGFLLLGGGNLFGRNHNGHALALEHGHLVELAIVLKVVGKAQQQCLALLFEQD